MLEENKPKGKVEVVEKVVTNVVYRVDEATLKEIEDKEREIVRLRMALFALKVKLNKK